MTEHVHDVYCLASCPASQQPRRQLVITVDLSAPRDDHPDVLGALLHRFANYVIGGSTPPVLKDAAGREVLRSEFLETPAVPVEESGPIEGATLDQLHRKLQAIEEGDWSSEYERTRQLKQVRAIRKELERRKAARGHSEGK